MEDTGRCQKHRREMSLPPDQQEYPPVPLVNVDMFEDKDFLVNRLYITLCQVFPRGTFTACSTMRRTRSGKRKTAA